MTWSDIVRRGTKLMSDNSPAILSGFAVAGTVATAYLAGRASFKAAEVLRDAQVERNLQRKDGYGELLTPRDKFEAVWKLYIPAAGSAVATIGFILAAHRVADRRAAALAAAYAISERAFERYKEKIVERLGERKEQSFRDEIAQEKVTQNPPPEILDMVYDEAGSVLCCDAFTGRYFISDMETIRRAVNDVNHQVNNDYYASLSDFYDRIGLERTSMSDDFGWNADKLLDVDFTTTLTPRGRPCLVMDFRVAPIRGYARLQ